jgi:hypothetical protein
MKGKLMEVRRALNVLRILFKRKLHVIALVDSFPRVQRKGFLAHSPCFRNHKQKGLKTGEDILGVQVNSLLFWSSWSGKQFIPPVLKVFLKYDNGILCVESASLY